MREQAEGPVVAAPTRPTPTVAVVGLVSWLVFGFAWWRVGELHAQVGNDVLAAVVVCAVLVLGVDVWWVRHNRRIYVRRGPRRGLPSADPDRSCDSLGRPFVWADGVVDAPVVVLDMRADGTKSLSPGTF